MKSMNRTNSEITQCKERQGQRMKHLIKEYQDKIAELIKENYHLKDSCEDKYFMANNYKRKIRTLQTVIEIYDNEVKDLKLRIEELEKQEAVQHDQMETFKN